MPRRTLGMLALALSCLGAACDDGTDLTDAPAMALAQRPPQPMFCGRFSLRRSLPGRLPLLQHEVLEAPQTSFLGSSAALAGTFGEGTCRLQLTQFADAQ